MPQVALAKAVLFLQEESDMDSDAIYRAINKIDWRWKRGSQFEGMVITSDGTILTGSKIEKRLTQMIIYWVLGRSKYENHPSLGKKKVDELDKEYRKTTKNKGEFPKAN